MARGGVITFNCGPNPVVIKMTATAKLRNTSHRVVLDGGGLVTLNGGGKHQILYLNTCDAKQKITTSDCYNQQWPQLIVQNITLENGNSQVRQSPNVNYGGGGGGAIFDLGGQLKVVNTRFLNNRCYAHGPDLGGAAIRALAQWRNRPVYITKDTFTGGRCSNGGALSSIGVSWVVTNSVMTNNRAIGYGQNPAQPGTAGGGSGGAIYNDGDRYYAEDRGHGHPQQPRPGGRRRHLLRQRQQHRLADDQELDAAQQPQRGVLDPAVPGHLLPQHRAPADRQLQAELTPRAGIMGGQGVGYGLVHRSVRHQPGL